MNSTHEALDLLRGANPGARITEDQIRHALRRGDLLRPRVVAGRYIWAPQDLERLAAALGLRPPTSARNPREGEA